jgi:hypothetical protein
MSPDPVNPIDFQFEDPEEFAAALMEPQDWNRYPYARNNPLFFNDPNGESAAAAVWGTAGGAVLIDGPLPIGDLIAAGILAGYAAHEIGEAIASYRERKVEKQINSLGQRAAEHIEKIASSDPNDPNRDKWGREVENWVKQIEDKAKRLKGKAKEKAEELARSLRGRAKKAKEKRKGDGPNQYGIDPDGPLGPMPDPCQGQPMCSGGR